MADTRFSRFVLIVNCGVPLAIIGWDALHHQLGADPVNLAIHTTGWLALMFLTLSLLVTPLRQITRLNRLVVYRRNLGVYGFIYAAAHLSIYFWWDRGRSVSSTWHEILYSKFIAYGAIALLLLTPLALTSFNGMIRLLGPKRWGVLHTLAYPATALAALHYWIEGKVVTWDKKMFAIAIATLLAYRWIARLITAWKTSKTRPPAMAAAMAAPTPLANRMAAKPKFWRGQLKIARIFRETPSVQTFRLVPPDGGPLPFDYLPGQYLNLALTIDGKKVPRSYTIASSPTRRDYCEVTVKREDMGTASRHLHDRMEGHVLAVSAPAGKFTFTGMEADGVTLIAGGVGITPMMSIVRSLTDRCWPGQIDLFFSVRTPAEIIFADEIAALAERFPNFHPHICVTQANDADWNGLRGRIDAALLQRFVPDLTARITYICGPMPMLEPMRELLKSLGASEDKIKFETFVSPSKSGDADDSSAMTDAMPGTIADSMSADMPVADEQPAGGGTPMVTFARSGKTAAISPDDTVLDAAEACGVNIEYECRAGVCGTCKSRLTAGRVTMDAEDALSATEKSNGYILACQAHAVGDVTIDV